LDYSDCHVRAFRSTAEILSTTSIIPQQPTLANFAYLSARTNFWGFFVSSLIVASLGTVISIICAGAAGYTLSRYHKLRSVSNYSRGLMLVQMFPLILALIPLFIIFKNAGLVNTYWSVILVYTVLNLPFATWMFEGFFDAIPPRSGRSGLCGWLYPHWQPQEDRAAALGSGHGCRDHLHVPTML
jgi:ABC-type glycerol-3-phosphate transport system permease component